MLDTWLTRELGLRLPIIGAPMGGRAGGVLAGAVSAAGGLGMLGAAGYTSPEWIAAESAIAREAGGGLFGIGLQTWSLADNPAMVDAAIEARPTVIALSFGDPDGYAQRIKEAGIPTLSQINSVQDLRLAERAGIDVIVAQGTEAGGHTGRVATLPLLQEILDATDRPVLAAGGIATGRGLAAVLAAGAQGALIGTALLASPEAVGPAYAVPRLLAAGSTDTVYTPVFDQARHQPWPQRWYGRALTNEFTEKFHDAGGDEGAIAAAYDGADPDIGVVYAGQAAGLVNAERPAGDIVAEIAARAEELLRRYG
ncbi:nitronate monooxygenase [Aldersonia sp. NBC_00410]|uniref:NAD(P)H-dependent flavin oxidoreductase n=1 Tax=Aldersonia sp. NBC_00410 TaxID=2975954 RepID=UPI002250EBC7|nr:nitronate monooxygenase [Aldersonia sp. NBC_00410]MCX5042744.1 nitronate monooxygenase [Aldersonia sp. NBC_00410]